MNETLLNFVPSARISRGLSAALAGGMLVALAGCGQRETQVYTVPKEDYQPIAPTAPKVSWDQPSDWEEQYGGEMRYTGFKTTSGVDIAVTPIPDMRGSELDNVNRWRGQVGLGPIAEGEVDSFRKEVSVGDEKGGLYEMVSQAPLPGKSARTRIIAAALKRPGNVWYFKMTGPDEAVQAEREKFLAFLASTSIVAPEVAAPAASMMAGQMPPMSAPMAPPMSAPMAGGGGGGAPRPEWTVPEGWQDLGSSGMRAATFSITDADGSAEVSVIPFPGTVGTVESNVDRWRGQVGLNPVPPSEVGNYTETLEIGGEKAILVDTSGHPEYKDSAAQRIVAVIWERAGKTWFYKLQGADKTVGTYKQSLVDFVKSVKYSDNG